MERIISFEIQTILASTKQRDHILRPVVNL